ncbi:MAG TPA: hypothetical protein VLE03_06675 [Nitrospiraceae bacterium]|nr:hypothetical protein [Nitrospiraceae bacterium]
MISEKTGEAPSTKERLENGFALVQFILEQREATEDHGFAWGIEQGIVARELDELEADLHSLRPPQASSAPPLVQNPLLRLPGRGFRIIHWLRLRLGRVLGRLRHLDILWTK